MMHLEPCPHCHRHVKVSETSCPFCAGSVDFTNIAPRTGPRARLGRAATFAFGVIAMSQAGCGDDTSSGVDAATIHHEDGGHDAAIDAPPDADDWDGGGVPIYAAAPTQNGSGTPTSRG